MAIYIQKQGVPYRIGYAMIPNRKKPQLVVEAGSTCKTYGQFKDEQSAEEWFNLFIGILSLKRVSEITYGEDD